MDTHTKVAYTIAFILVVIGLIWDLLSHNLMYWICAILAILVVVGNLLIIMRKM